MSIKSVQTAETINKQLERLLPVLFPFGIVLGFIMPGVFGYLRPLVIWLFAVMTLSGALKLKVSEFGCTIRSPIPIVAFLLTTRVIMPSITLLAASVFFGGSPYTVTGFVLLFSGPTAVASFIWVGMFKGDRALGLTLVLLDTILAPLVVPTTVSLLMGETVAMNMGGIALSLLWMVVVPTIVGVVVNETSKGKIPAIVCPYLNPISKIFLMLVISANTSAVAPTITLGDPMLWKVAALSVALAAIGFTLAKLSGIAARCNPEKRVTLFFSGGLKNISAMATITVAFFPEAAALPIITGILFQQIMAAIMSKLLMRKAHS